MAVLSASRLTGQSTFVVTGILEFVPGSSDVYYIAVNQLASGTHSLDHSSAPRIAEFCKPVVAELHSRQPANLRLSRLASLYSALISDEVHIVHKKGVAVLQKKAEETVADFDARIAQLISTLDEVSLPVIPELLDAPAKHHFFFGGELLSVGQVLQTNPVNHLTVVNLRSDTPKEETKRSGRTEYTSITGSDLLEFLVQEKK